MIRKHFRFRRYVLGLAFAAVLVAPAAAQAYSGAFTDGPATGVQQTDARHAALLNKQNVAPASPLSAQPTGIGQQAYAARLQAMADRYQSMGQSTVRSENSFGAPGPSAGGAQGPVVVKTASASSSSGFDWNDAGIGAAVAFGIAVLLVTAVALGRRYRHTDGTGLARA
jgi:type IV pilus biogenesis protein CpaD/CtpE